MSTSENDLREELRREELARRGQTIRAQDAEAEVRKLSAMNDCAMRSDATHVTPVPMSDLRLLHFRELVSEGRYLGPNYVSELLSEIHRLRRAMPQGQKHESVSQRLCEIEHRLHILEIGTHE